MREGYRGSTEPVPAIKTVRLTSINDKGEIVTCGGLIVGKVIYMDARPASGTGSMRGLSRCSRCGKGTVPPGQVCEACSTTDPACIYCGGVGHKPEDCATPCDGLRDEIHTLKLQRRVLAYLVQIAPVPAAPIKWVLWAILLVIALVALLPFLGIHTLGVVLR